MTAALPAFVYTGLIMTEVTFLAVVTLLLWQLWRTLLDPSVRNQVARPGRNVRGGGDPPQGVDPPPVDRARDLADGLVLPRPAVPAAVRAARGRSGSRLRRRGGGRDRRSSRLARPLRSRRRARLRRLRGPALDRLHGRRPAPARGGHTGVRGASCSPSCRSRAARTSGWGRWWLLLLPYAVLLVVEMGTYVSRFDLRLIERSLITLAPPLFIALVAWVDRGMPRARWTVVIALALLAPAFFWPTGKLVDKRSSRTPSRRSRCST